MSSYTATIRWAAQPNEAFAKGQYSRAHEWAFDGGAVVRASASPHIVPAPWSDEAGVDPEEAFIASLSSCHMLFFLDFAKRGGFAVAEYVDQAGGELGKLSDGRMAMTSVTLRPKVERRSARRRRDRQFPPPRARSLLHRQFGHDESGSRASLTRHPELVSGSIFVEGGAVRR